jgi:uncharacterized protein (DUF433 family)
MALLLEAQQVPIIEMDSVLRVGQTRVRLATVVHAFNEGATAEEIVNYYPSLSLADVYAVISYYLNHRQEIDRYLEKSQEKAAKNRAKIVSEPEYQQFREQILKRQENLDFYD